MLLKDMFDLKNKVILITGGSGHLGKSMCEALAEYGATLIVGSRDVERNREFSEQLTNDFGNENCPLMIDVSSSESINNTVRYITQTYGKIDVLINNASFGAGRDILSMTNEQWETGIDGTVNSVFRCTKAILPHMLENGYGKIINISSMYGLVSPDVSIYENNDYYNPANYGAGKAAIIQFTKYVAAVYGKYGINSNSISPGPFPSVKVQNDTQFVDRLTEKVPLKRIGNPDDLKGAVLLLSSNASNYINGANIVIDGGWTIW
nr:SDR family oxidoreductase [uncultured Methanolobus sp.]